MPNLSPIPDEESVVKFVDALSRHDKVLSAKRQSDTCLVHVVLRTGAELNVWMTNIYVVGEADVEEILGQNEHISAVVTLSAWNMVSDIARECGSRASVGVFTWKDVFGALNYKKYWLYEPMPASIDGEKADRERQRRRRAWN